MNPGRRFVVPIRHRQVLLVLLLSLIGVGVTAGISPAEGKRKSSAVVGSMNFGVIHFLDDDLAETYGSVALVGLRFSRLVDERGEWFLQVGYGSDEGDPYYGVPDFRSSTRSDLQVVPLDLGFRVTADSRSAFRFYFGLMIRALWVEEKRPSAYATPPLVQSAGWGPGFAFLIGPEWRLPGQNASIVAQLAFGPQRVNLGYEIHGTDFTGLDTRVGMSIPF